MFRSFRVGGNRDRKLNGTDFIARQRQLPTVPARYVPRNCQTQARASRLSCKEGFKDMLDRATRNWAVHILDIDSDYSIAALSAERNHRAGRRRVDSIHNEI